MDFQVSNNDISNYSDEKVVQFILDHKNIEDKNLGYTQLYNKYFNKAINFYGIRGVDEEEAKDLIQEVFLIVFNKLDKFHENSKFNSRFYIAGRNALVDHIRKKNKENLKLKKYIFDQSVNSLSKEKNEFITENEHILKNNKIEFQKRIFSSLSDQDQNLLNLKYKDRFKDKEIQEIFQLWSQWHVQSRLKIVIKRAQDLYNAHKMTE